MRSGSYLQYTGGEPRPRKTEQVLRTSQLLSRWLLAQPVTPGTAGLAWQDTVPGQAELRPCGWQRKGAPRSFRNGSELCQRDIRNVAKQRPVLGTLLGNLIVLTAVFQNCISVFWLGQNHAEDLWSLLDVNQALLIPKLSFGPQDHHSSSAELGSVNHCGALATAQSQVLPWNQWFSPVLL